jgi:hypothetical protein
MTHPRIERSLLLPNTRFPLYRVRMRASATGLSSWCVESGGNIRDVKVTTNRRADNQKAELVELIMMTCPRIERGVCLT